jgi:L-ascorbate metabolism protein UlaG (beta-lactamase superfamily)
VIRRRWRWLLAGLLLGAAAMAAKFYFVRPGMTEYAAHHYGPVAGTGELSASWFGTTAVLLSDGEHAVMVDPFFTRPPGFLNLVLNRSIAPDQELIARWLERAGVTKLDAVLVSHSHYDHAMDAGVVAMLTGARLMGSASTLNIGRGAGMPEDRLRPAASPASFGPFRVSFIESRHAGASGGNPTGDIEQPLAAPAHYMDYRQGGTYSILIEHPQGSVLHHGSAGFVPGALNGRRADVVFLGVALIDELAPYLAETVDRVGARRVIPVHWDDFLQPLDEPLRPFPGAVRLDKFFTGMQRLRPEVAVQTLEVAKRVALFPRGTP